MCINALIFLVRQNWHESGPGPGSTREHLKSAINVSGDRPIDGMLNNAFPCPSIGSAFNSY